MRAALFGCAVLLVTACSNDLRAEVGAAGVFSPRRVDVGQPDLVALGQMLFFDRELSGNRNIACATCHLPPLHAVDERRLAIGQDQARLTRSAVDLFNRGTVEVMFWDGRLAMRDGAIVAPVPMPEGVATLLQAQALLPLLDRHEMRGVSGDVAVDGRANELAMLPDDSAEAIWSAIVVRLLAIEGYRTLFARAFPSVAMADLSIVHVARAIASFESRLWELTDTPFDDYLGSVSEPGRDDALDDRQRRGAEIFFGDGGCARCHDGPLLSDDRFHDIGVPQIGPGRDAQHRDEGRFAVTGSESDRFAFRTPPLRNVALTPPYMHDGAYTSLEEAVRHHLDPIGALARYDGITLPSDLAGQVHHELDEAIAANLDPDTRPLRSLEEADVEALLAFLQSLSSRTEMSLPPMAGMPSAVPSGLPIETVPLDTEAFGSGRH
jgi:cytochrome c peroxidase